MPILVTRSLPPYGLDPLKGYELLQHPEDEVMPRAELLRLVADVEGLICVLTDRIDEELFAAAPQLKVVAGVAVGYDNVDVAAATRAGVAVCNTPGVLDETTADLAFALILAASRATSDAERDLREGRWTQWKMNAFLGRDVVGATLGIVGYGRIGRAVARRAEGFSMRVLHHGRRPTGTRGFVPNLDDLLALSDIVTVHVPLNDQTRHLIDRERLRLMKPSAVLVNTSRGPVVDEEALAEALIDGDIFAAGLDVYEEEPSVHPRLLEAPRAVLLPHIGSATKATRTKMAQLAAQGVADVLEGRRPRNLVNPEVFGP